MTTKTVQRKQSRAMAFCLEDSLDTGYIFVHAIHIMEHLIGIWCRAVKYGVGLSNTGKGCQIRCRAVKYGERRSNVV